MRDGLRLREVGPEARQLPAEFSLASKQMAGRAWASSDVDVTYLGKASMLRRIEKSREKWEG